MGIIARLVTLGPAGSYLLPVALLLCVPLGARCQSEVKLIVSAGYSVAVVEARYSPDGKTLAVGENEAVRLWSVETGKELRTLPGELRGRSISFSPDGKVLSAGAKDSIRMWDVESGKELQSIPTGSYAVEVTALGPRAKMVAISDRNTIEMWDVESGKGVCTLPLRGRVTSLLFSPDGKRLVVMREVSYEDSDKERVILWDVERKVKLTAFDDLAGPVAFSPDGAFMAVGNLVATEPKAEDSRGRGFRTIKLFRTENGAEVRPLGSPSQEGITAMAFSEEGEVLAVGTRQTVRLLNVGSGRELQAFTSGIPYRMLALSPGGNSLVSVNDEALELQDVRSGEILLTVSPAASIHSFAFSPGGRLIALADAKRVKLWSAEGTTELRTISDTVHGPATVEFSPNGKLLLIADARRITVFDLDRGRETVTVLSGSRDALKSVFSPDGKTLAVSDRTTVRLLDASSGQERRAFYGQSYNIQQIAFSPKGNELAIREGKGGRAVRLIDVDTGSETRTFFGDGPVNSFSFSPDGKAVAVCGGKAIHVFDATTGKESWIVKDGRGCAASSFSPDGKILAVGDAMKTVRLLDASSGQERRAFSGEGLNGPLTFTPDGRALAWASKQSISLTNTSTGQPLSSFLRVGQNDWAIVTPEGRFDASPGAFKHMHYSYGLEIISLEQLKDVYYEPTLLRKLLGGEQLRPVRPLRNIRLFPEVVERSYDPATSVLHISLRNRGGGIGPVRVMVGVKLAYEDARSPEVATNPDVATAKLSVDLAKFTHMRSPGSKITIITNNLDPETGQGYISSRGAELPFGDAEPGRTDAKEHYNFYAIVGGVSDYDGGGIDLKYAAKDAEAVAAALELGAKNLFSRTRVITLSTSRKPGTVWPSKANFRAAFKEVGESATTKDIVVVYLAGHGVSVGLHTDTYMYLTAEATNSSRATLLNPDFRASSAISSVELIEWLTQTEWVEGRKGIAAQKQVMILDTCAAEALANNLPFSAAREQATDQIRAIERFKDRTGFHVLMGSAADAVSYEASQYGQGLLTYSLLDGISGSALKEGRYVDISTLFQKTADAVPDLARGIGGIQRPVIAAPGGTSFDIGIITETDKHKIPLARLKPVVSRPLFTTGTEGDDTLDLIGKVGSSLDESVYLQSRGVDQEAAYVYRDEKNLPGAIRPTGTYTVRGGHIRLQIFLRRDGRTVMTFPIIRGRVSEIDAFAGKVAQDIRAALPKLK